MPGSLPGVPWWINADIHTILQYIKVAASDITDSDSVKFIKVDSGGRLCGVYNSTLPTYSDGDSVPFHFDDRGRLMVDTELTIDTNLVIDNLSVWQTDISDSSTMGPALIDAQGHPQVDVLSMPGGITGYAEDGAHSSGEIGFLALVVRNDTLAALCDTDGDRTVLQVNAKGGLYVDISSVSGSDIGNTNAVDTVPGSKGTGYHYEADSNFQVGDDATVIDINAALSRNASRGWFACDGPNDMGFEISEDGAAWGTEITIKNGEVISLDGFNVDSIRVQHLGTDSAYRVLAK